MGEPVLDPFSQGAAGDLASLAERVARLELRPGTIPLGYAESFADQLGFAGHTNLTNLTVTVTVGSQRLIRLNAYVHFRYATVGGTFQVRVMEPGVGGTQRGLGSMTRNAGEYGSLYVASVVAPSAGTHTYGVTGWANPAGTADVFAATGSPNYLFIEDVGLAPP